MKLRIANKIRKNVLQWDHGERYTMGQCNRAGDRLGRAERTHRRVQVARLKKACRIMRSRVAEVLP